MGLAHIVVLYYVHGATDGRVAVATVAAVVVMCYVPLENGGDFGGGSIHFWMGVSNVARGICKKIKTTTTTKKKESVV